MEDNKKDYEEVQLSNIWIKTHVLDLIDEINQLQTIARIGSLDLFSLSEMEDIEKTKVRLNSLDLMEAKIEVLKGNVFFKIDPNKKLKIILQLKQSQRVENLCKYISPNSFNQEQYSLNDNFNVKLNLLQKIKEDLIDACAEKGMLLPKVDEDLETKTPKDLEDEE
jgi:hypothetical protein